MTFWQQSLTGSGPGGVITVSGENIGGEGEAGVRFNADGTVDRNEGGSYTQIDSSTDWIRPEGLASGVHQIRATLESGDAPDEGLSLGDWHSMSADREWKWLGNSSGVILVEMGTGQVVADSGEYDVTSVAA